MIIAFTEIAWQDYQHWKDNEPEIFEKVNVLIKDISRDSFKGLGKPEPLRGNLAGYWSRRISGEHRLVYRVHGPRPNQTITIIQVRFYY